MHFNGFLFTIHKEFILKLEKLKCSLCPFGITLEHNYKDFIIRTLRKGVGFIYRNVGQDMIHLN